VPTVRTGLLRKLCAIPTPSRLRCPPRPNIWCVTPSPKAQRFWSRTYNEPLITSEWAVAVFKEAKAAGLITASFPTATPRRKSGIPAPLDRLYKVDLKSFDDRHYHELGGRIGPISTAFAAFMK